MEKETQFTCQQQIECVRREIGMREWAYPNWVAIKKLKPGKADYEIACMKAVLDTLTNLDRQIEEATK